MRNVRRCLFGLALVAILFVLPSVALAGTSYIYMQAGQAELGTTTPCAASTKTDASNGQPYTVLDCTTTTADTLYFHFTIPNDYSAANTSGNLVVAQEYMPETDATAGRTACWKASITAFPPAASTNYRTSALATPAGTFLWDTSTGQYQPTDSVTGLTNIVNAATGVDCTGTACINSQATLKMQRFACGGGTTDLSGAVGLINVFISYRN